MSSTDTIFALATPPAKSGIAIFRISGSKALDALKQLITNADIEPRRAHYLTLYKPDSQTVIDQGLVLYFDNPRSFTGEDVVELHLHGGLAIIKELHAILGHMQDLRPAEPGEFTRRAFINGKMDLIEAEGLADLIDAETTQQKSQALRQMQGELSLFYNQLRMDITQCMAHLEAYIDFPDEDIPEAVLDQLDTEIEQTSQTIRNALEDQGRGERLRDGISIAILGAPNVGKSSLLNHIAKRDAAIVSERAGTTRDVIEVHLDIAGYPVVFMDTAGIHDSQDDIEQEGIRRALTRGKEADITLVLFDGQEWPHKNPATAALMDHRAIPIISKCDLAVDKPDPIAALCLSTQSGEGIDELLDLIKKRLMDFFTEAESSFITRQRHRSLLGEGLAQLEKAKHPLPLELKCEELRRAALAIGKITGKIQVDDVLELIFSEFCIGK